MTVASLQSAPGGAVGGRSRRILFFQLLLLVAIALAYANSLHGPFVFDDRAAVVDNPTIRHWSTALAAPAAGSTTSGRPLVNLSFALNHAISGDAVWSYHALNILIHAGAALVLFGLLRHTLVLPVFGGSFSVNADRFAFAVAVLWALHPLQTESVTCVAQRTELLYGLAGLTALFCWLRGATVPQGKRWLILAALACWLGMAAKEVMVSVPLLVLLYDRTFLAGSFAAAWRLRGRYHVALGASWLLLAGLVALGGGTRGAAAGFGLGVSVWSYLLTQAGALVIYLKLCIWPHPLVLDYGTAVVRSPDEVWWQGLVVLGLLGATAWALVRRPRLGFVGAWFFLLLAPSSSVLPLVTQTVAEHRMYLSLAAPLLLVVLGLGRLFPRSGLVVCLVLAAGGLGLTVARNRDYRSAIVLWSDTAVKQPANARAHLNLAEALLAANEAAAEDPIGRPERLRAALEHATRAAGLQPGEAGAHSNRGLALLQLGRPAEAVAAFRQAVQLRAGDPGLRHNLGSALAQMGRWPEAIDEFHAALGLAPGPSEMISLHTDLGHALFKAGRMAEAAEVYERVVRAQPESAVIQYQLGLALGLSGRTAEARTRFQTLLRLQPDHANARRALAALQGLP